MAKIKVVVVDDSALVRSLLTEIINRQHDMVCIGAASDPLVAREMIRELNPDVITLDVEMPRMDGLEFLSRLMRLRPMPVVMVSTLTEQGAEITLRALEMGAVDYVAKPRIGISSGLQELATDIVDKIRVAAGAHVKRLGPAPTATLCQLARQVRLFRYQDLTKYLMPLAVQHFAHVIQRLPDLPVLIAGAYRQLLLLVRCLFQSAKQFQYDRDEFLQAHEGFDLFHTVNQ